ncbi:hypothetical protein [Haladaptatus halobius]|uniref:hypothetical protein n=1 Tax=Haladaptatus halobius TaxID=2884875 RepID=UPI001D0B1A91|nr:hypothetical protein [Haladaptatus halobius]
MTCDDSAHVSGVVIQLAISESHFAIRDVQDELERNINEGVINGVLVQLKSDGWIEKVSDSPFGRWKTGPIAHEYGNMVKFAKKSEGEIPVLPDEQLK